MNFTEATAYARVLFQEPNQEIVLLSNDALLRRNCVYVFYKKLSQSTGEMVLTALVSNFGNNNELLLNLDVEGLRDVTNDDLVNYTAPYEDVRRIGE